MNLRSQLLKGVLEGCILFIIKQEAAYGYELSLKLQEFGLDDISEGSIYPILLRLQKENFVYGKMEASLSGPKRKYYHLTEQGAEALGEIFGEWGKIQASVEAISDWGEEQ